MSRGHQDHGDVVTCGLWSVPAVCPCMHVMKAEAQPQMRPDSVIVEGREDLSVSVFVFVSGKQLVLHVCPK